MILACRTANPTSFLCCVVGSASLLSATAIFLEVSNNLANVDADIYFKNLGAGKDIEVSDRKRQGMEKKRLISTLRT